MSKKPIIEVAEEKVLVTNIHCPKCSAILAFSYTHYEKTTYRCPTDGCEYTHTTALEYPKRTVVLVSKS